MNPGSALSAEVSGTGPRMVLVHGFTQNARSFRQVAGALSTDHEVVTVDLPGHGGSTEIEAANLERTAALVGAVGGAGTYLGYSLGGRVCLTLAHARPELVERLILVGATAGIVDDDERAARRASDGALADRLDPPDGGAGEPLEVFLEQWLAQPIFADLSPEAQDRDARRGNTPSGLAASLRTTGTGTQTPTHGRLGELDMAVLLVVGAKDAKFTAIAREMAVAIGANASVVLIEGAGHAAPFEQPDRFLAAVTGWLAEHR